MSRDIKEWDWRQLRNQVLERDGYECQRCGKSQDASKSLHAHHERRVVEGGEDHPENLTTVCKECHDKIHAEDRRKGTLEDIKDIYRKAEVPIFRTGEIADRLDNYSHQASTKLQKLEEEGFLYSNERGIYHTLEIPSEELTLGGPGVIVKGSVIQDGKYVGEEEKILQCDSCKRYIYSASPERQLRKHKKRCE